MQNKIKPSLFELSLSFFILGLTAYSMAMLEELKQLNKKKNWLSDEEIDKGLAMVQLYPGPIFIDLAIYISYKLKGIIGAFLAMFFFLLPSFAIMLILSFTYFHYGKVSFIHPLFMVLEAMVIGIIIKVAIDFAKKYIKDKISSIIAAISFILMIYKIDAFYIILFAFFTSIFFKAPENLEKSDKKINFLPIIISGIIFLALLFYGYFKNILLFEMFKVGAVAFGNGMTILPLLEEVVMHHHWMSLKEFTDGIAFGQITPGPFLITAVFIGYKVSGIIGSILATIGIFYPSFFYTIVMGEIYEKIKHLTIIQKILKSLLASFTGMIFFVGLSLGKISLTTHLSFVYAVFAFIAVKYFKINVLWVFIIGILSELLIKAIF